MPCWCGRSKRVGTIMREPVGRQDGEHTREGIDLVGPAEVVFDKDGLGSIRFMSTQADLDCRFVDRAGEVFVEFTWVGYRGTAPASGRGWACVLKTGGMMGLSPSG